MTAASVASGFMPGAGLADAPKSFAEGWDNIKGGEYTKGAVNYAVGAFDAASDMFPMTAAIPPIGAMMRKGDDISEQTEKVFGEGIKAYHGSPADFDKFRWDDEVRSKGLGAQVKGDGLYFAQNEGVAQSAKRGSGFLNNKIELIDKSTQKPLSEKIPGYKTVYDFWNTYIGDVRSGDIDHMVEKLNRDLDNYRYQVAEYQNWLDNEAKTSDDIGWAEDQILQLQNLKKEKTAAIDLIRKVKGKAIGTMYEVRIATSDERLLDLDKPFSQQSDHVKNGMQRTANYLLNEADEETLKLYGPRFSKIASGNSEATGLDFIYDLEELIAQMPPEKTAGLGSTYKNKASGAMKTWGIDGSKFLDSLYSFQNNYVIFDPELITIVRKFGIATLVASGLLSQELASILGEEGIDKKT